MLYVRPNTVQTVLFHNWIKLVQIFAQITSFKIISSNINFEDFDFASDLFSKIVQGADLMKN